MVHDFWFTYLVTLFVASIIPGPSMMLALTHGMRHGTSAAAVSGVGNVVASLIQAGVSMAGLGILLTTCEPLFMAVRYAGAVYLVWLGIGLWRSAPPDMAPASLSGPRSAPLRKLWLDAFLVAMGNPKAIVFFAALFPQFIHSVSITVRECTFLAGGLAVPAFAAWMIYALCGRRVAGMFSGSGIGRWANRVLGGTFVGLGVGLATNRG